MTAIPAPADQVLPSAANAFKAAVLLLLLLGSFALAQWIVDTLADSSLQPLARAVLMCGAVALLGVGNVHAADRHGHPGP